MYHIIICDDDELFIRYIKRTILMCGLHKEDIVFYEYISGESFINSIENLVNCDLLILDMQMKKLDGYKTAEIFRKAFTDSTLVFCSGIYYPTVESFRATPFRYLLKSYSDQKMLSEMNAIIQHVKSKKSEPYIVGSYHYSLVKLKPSDILFIEIAKHGCIVHVCEDKIEYSFEENIIIKQKLGEVYEILKDFGFRQAHNSYIVNLKYVIKIISYNEIKLIDGTILTISRSKAKDFRLALSEELSHQYNI